LLPYCLCDETILNSEEKLQKTMTSIGELFPKCRKLAYDARQQLAMIQQQQQQQQLQSNNSSTARTAIMTPPRITVSELYLVLEELNHQLESMEQLLMRETPAQRQVWKHKISELRQEGASLQQQGQRMAESSAAHRHSLSSYYQRDRNDLLRHRKRRDGGGEDDMRNYAKESQSLGQSQSAVMSLISQGQDSLNGLVEQRHRLRGVRRVLVDIGSSLVSLSRLCVSLSVAI
jgi:golgi SNAP receptor complex member 2